MKKLEYIDYSETGRMGPNILLVKIDNLKVGRGLRISGFPSYQKMRELTSKVEPHLSQDYIFTRVTDEKNLIYTVRRIA